MPPRTASARPAFTLVEILVVVVILGVLAAIVVPLFADSSDDTRRAAFITELRVFMDAAEHYAVREGSWVPDGSSGICPPEFAPYVNVAEFEGGTPIAGVWDTERNDSGVTSAVGVHFDVADEAKDDAYMLLIDEIIDDGDLSTGTFQKLADGRYYGIIQP